MYISLKNLMGFIPRHLTVILVNNYQGSSLKDDTEQSDSK